MNMAGTSAGAVGHGGQWAGAGSSSLTCNPRKFSEKIALHTQRQAEDTAAFQEVMMDITSTRIHAQRLRQARSLASYYGGSLPNVNQIAKCSTELQADSAPYLSFHLSPPTSSGWRRQWSNRSVNGKGQVDQLPVTTLSRTNSDSALHTSVKVTYMRDSNPAQVLTACSRPSVNLFFLQGTPVFHHPVPLIEENVQEEGKPFKSQKTSSVLPGCGTLGNCVFPSPDLSCSLPNVPCLSTSGSLPDLSSLHLPSTAPEVIDPERQSHVSSLSSPISIHLPSTPAHSTIVTDSDFPLTSLSSSLQASTSNPSLQSSLSNPNLQATLSSHSLVESFSSASLSLSNSSLHSSVSSQSLRSSLSSSSLSNQSAQSAASHCSYSSGIGGSSSSLSCSPHASGQGMVPRSTSSWKRAQLNPLIVPSGGETLWQQPKQLSPSVSSTFSPISQGIPSDSIKAKPSAYHYSHLPPAGHPMAYQSLQPYQPEGWDQSRRDTGKQCQQEVLQPSGSQHKSQPQYSQYPAHKAHLDPHHCVPQQQLHEPKQDLHHQYRQAQQQSLHQQCQASQQYLPHQPQQYKSHHHAQSLQHQQQYQALNQGWNSQLQPMHHTQYQQTYQYQSQPEGPPGDFQEQHPCPPPTVMASQDEDLCWQNQVNQHNQENMPNMGVQETAGACTHVKELPKLQSKMHVHDLRKERTTHYPKGMYSQRDQLKPSEIASAPLLDQNFRLHNESYAGLHLTPSQTEALSQKLGHLHKEPSDVSRTSDFKCQDVEEKELPTGANLWHPQSQSQSKEGLHGFSSTSTEVPFPWLDDELPDLPDSIPEFDLEPFALED
ncbi:hypothetical protein NFI96_015919 [Prochilodus magdalenae]|nr:hypothetical protein NFI96_015919 [Prochilodus magdalenae]